MLEMTKINISNKTVLIRTDLNVPIQNGKITSYARILAAIPTIKYAIKQKSKIIVMSHLGRPTEGIYDNQFSLFPIFEYLKKFFFKENIFFHKNYLRPLKIEPGQICLLENVRFNIGENKNCNILSENYSKLCDIFVMDAFGCSHRVQSSTYGISNYAKIACAGPLLISELKSLKKIFQNPKRPIVSVIGGSKVSTKFNILESLGKISDTVIVGGGIANTFIAINNNVGKSLHEKRFIPLAKQLTKKYNILTPIDSRVGIGFSNTTQSKVKLTSEINNKEEIMDIGDQTAKIASNLIAKAKTIIWNGPVGVFEFLNFRKGTEIISTSIANSKAFSIAGGGDTLSAIEMFNIKEKISYISTGGGAFLKFLERKKLPTIEVLEQRCNKKTK